MTSALLSLVPPAPPEPGAPNARDLLAAALARLAAADAAGAAALARAAAEVLDGDALRVADGGASFTFRGRTVSLRRRAVLRRALDVLATAARERPGECVSMDALDAAVWPGASFDEGCRVYTTIKRLRAIGLDGALLTVDGGYLIDPRVRVLCAPLRDPHR